MLSASYENITESLGGPVLRGRDNCLAKWPPVVEQIEKIGYVQGRGQPFYSHDIGRSFELGGRIYYINGDTFCNDAGISSNTYQVVEDGRWPTEAMYVLLDDHGFITPLIDADEQEMEYLILPENRSKRIAFWCFGGVVETSRNIGWVWYQKHIIDNRDKSDILVGVGLARIAQDRPRLDELSSARMPDLMFHCGEPLFGSFSTLIHGDMVYLWGQKDTDVFLARVAKDDCQHRDMYQYWNGSNYVSVISEAAPVLKDYQQGQFFQSDLFGSRSWVFVGCTKWGDSQVMIGTSNHLEGPWEVHPVHLATGIKDTNNFRYFSWCEHWPGGVIAAKIRFAVDPAIYTYWARIPVSGYSSRLISVAISKNSEMCHENGVTLTELDLPPRLSVRGMDQQKVEFASNMIWGSIAMAEKEEEIAGQNAAPAETPKRGLGKRFITSIIKHACG
ncbi:MAG: hypothetical protein Q9221_001569 [Calogaya cf. arnoldii]